MKRRIAETSVFWLLFAATSFMPAAAQQGGREDGAAATTNGEPLGRAGQWPVESIELKSGTVYRGLVQSAGEHELEFIEVVRPPGKPMYLVIRPVVLEDVAQLKRLPDGEREKLSGKINRFRNRVIVEAGRLENVPLTRMAGSDVPHFRYVGTWFTVRSTADEETTRRCVVRIEQIFRAYRLILAPRTSPRRRLEVLLFGCMDEYRNYLRRYGPALENPSFYLADQNRIVAAGELRRFAEHLAEARGQHERIRQMYEALDADLPQRLQHLADKLELGGYSRQEIVDEVKARQNAWALEKKAVFDKIIATNRRNDRKFNELTREMFNRLYHEAFHAYLDNYVYPHNRYRVPRWLNEGLAQIFESGQLDNDTLRIDAPERRALLAVQELIDSERPLSLADVLWADERDFLTAHEGTGGAAQQIYYLSWALAYYLTFLGEQPVWGTAEIDAYVTPDDRELPPTARFERLVGMPLSKFTRKWQTAIRELTPPPR